MERQVTQLVTILVDDLLDVSRITRGKLELRKCELLVDEVIQSAVEASMPLINAAGHTLHLEPLATAAADDRRPSSHSADYFELA